MSAESISATEVEALRRAIGGVLFNVSNFPEPAQVRLLGQDMGPLNDRLTAAIVEVWMPGVVARARRVALQEAAEAVLSERLTDETGDNADEAYNQAIGDGVRAIRDIDTEGGGY